MEDRRLHSVVHDDHNYKENNLKRNEGRDGVECGRGKMNHGSNANLNGHELDPLNSNEKMDCFGPKEAQILLSVLGFHPMSTMK